MVSATLDKDDTRVSIQSRTDFATSAHAQAIQVVLQNAIEFLSRSALQDGRAAKSNGPLYDAYFLHAIGTVETVALEQWRDQFVGVDAGCHFPSLPITPHILSVDNTASCIIQHFRWREDCDATTQILASWALLQASYARSTDILIGLCPLDSGTDLAGAALPLPMRLKVNLEQNVSSYLDSVQSRTATFSKLPPLALHRLRGLSSESAIACDFQTVLTIRETPAQGGRQGLEADKAACALSIQFTIVDFRLELIAKFDEHIISTSQVTRLFAQFETVLLQICSQVYSTSAAIGLSTVSDQDIHNIFALNATHHESVQALVPDLISQTVHTMPDSPAISAWDGELTYRELDQLSTRLAQQLTRLGIGPEVIVPLYFEKSMWTPVSAVAVIKAGGVGVMIDSTQPVERASGIISQTRAQNVLVSRANVEKAAQFETVKLLVVDRASLDALSDLPTQTTLNHQLQPSNLVYISFTSGSTGHPKGAMITHSNFASSIKHQQKDLGFKAGERVFDFASYAFDAAWSNLLHSLTSGACLCIPSEEQRVNALSDAIQDSRASLLNITPSMLRHLNPEDFPALKQVLMGGEAWAEEDFVDWIDKKRLINSYGPGECTIKTTLLHVARGTAPNTLGKSIGLHTWIVRTDGSDMLAPYGAVGELWIEGPQVGRGYLADETKTAASYSERTLWNHSDGPLYRFYLTGDLVRYDEDGALVFVARKDSQVKIRGQRTEPGEIEYNIQKAILASDLKAQVIADVLKPKNSDNAIVIAFLKAQGAADWHKLAGLDERLSKLVPEYMIPTAYIALEGFPMTATGKVHRKSLREAYTEKTLEQIVMLDALRVHSRRPPSTKAEQLVQSLWAELLKINFGTISADDSFLRIGGDSLGAMRLVGMARKRGLALSVADIFKNPMLSALAQIIEIQEPFEQLAGSTVEPFSLLETAPSPEEAKEQAARLCGLELVDIEDVFPCTALQAGLLAETVQRPGDNILTQTKALRGEVDVSRLRAAWRKVVQVQPILRTRIVDLPHQGLVQVIVRHERCEIGDAITAHEFGLGTPLVSCKISNSSFFWSIHHALYDGWSEPILFECLFKGYKSEPLDAPPPYQAFIKWIKNCSPAKGEEFWKNQFRDFSAQNFPVLPSKAYKPICDQRLKLDIHEISSDGDFTVASKIRLAWAILLSTITNSADASFGTTVSGRSADVPSIEDITGPTFATVPLRVALDRSKTVHDLLQQVQLQAAEMIPFEQVGIQQIRRFGEDCSLGCQFQSHIIVQPAGVRAAEEALFKSSSVQFSADDTDPFKHYAIFLEFDLRPNSICLRADYDSSVVSPARFARLTDRFESILRQLSSPEVQAKPLSLLNTSSPKDLQQILSWNETIPPASNEKIHEIFAQVALKQPDAPAVCSWDGDLTYYQVDEASTRIAHELLGNGFSQSSQRVVPLFFEKSKWTSVCQIAVMKANGCSVALEALLPIGRVQQIIELTKPLVILTSADQEHRARELAPSNARVIVVSDTQVPTFTVPHDSRLPAVDANASLYVVFTSGSTGVPKGVQVSHASFASALKHARTALQFSPQSRVYDFISYAFDVSWLNMLHTLCTGGCLCIPSQYEIQNEPAEAISRRRANTAFVTPTVGKLLHGADLKVVAFLGENLPREEIQNWRNRAQIINAYGPAECTPLSISCIIDPDRDRIVIGKGIGARTWIVEPEFGNSLTAIGDIGELWLEGPIVGQGYLNDPVKTEAAFTSSPEWLKHNATGLIGGNSRFYRTGDLARYEEDGNVEFMGRKDAQVKIRGQRVELEEIEHHILSNFGAQSVQQVIVDVIKPVDSTDPILMSFIQLWQEKALLATAEAQILAGQLFDSVRDRLSTKIPGYMIPNAYVIVDTIPKTASGKLDRGKLRKEASLMRKDELLQVKQRAKRAPETTKEVKLHSLVARILSRDAGSFGMDDNFIQLGGDSIAAMRLTSMARTEGLTISVRDILTSSQIDDLVAIEQVGNLEQGSQSSQLASTGITNSQTFVKEEVMPQMRPGHGTFVDILPLTDMQSTYLRDNLYAPRRSWFYWYIDFSNIEDEDHLIQSCQRLVEHCDIYRTAFVRSHDSFFQVIFDNWKPTIDIFNIEDIETAFDRLVAEDVQSSATLGAPLLDFKLIRGRGATGKLVLGMSHAIYDAISLDYTLKALTNIYNGSSPSTVNFAGFIRHIHSQKADSYWYWRKTLESSSMTRVQCTSHIPTQDGPPTVLTRSVSAPIAPSGITQATIFTLACASALSRQAGSSDVVFGRVASCRANLPASLQEVIGPTLNRMPVRVCFKENQTKLERFIALQKQTTESIAHEAVGLSDIIENCTDWPQGKRDWGFWCQYQNVSDRPTVGLPGADAGGLRSKQGLSEVVPVAADFLEVHAAPSLDKATLEVTVFAGPGYAAEVVSGLLEDVCGELGDTN